MAIEIVSFPIKNGGSFHSYVSLPEGNQSIIATFVPIMVFPMALPTNWAISGSAFIIDPRTAWIHRIKVHDLQPAWARPP